MSGRTLLIVDDEYWIRYKLVTRYDWARFGFTHILEAENGEDAIALLECEKIDLVLTDMDMPIMDGGALVEWVHINCPEVFTLVLSGYSDFPLVRRALVGGAVDYLLKPMSENDLYQVMERVVGRIKELEEARHAEEQERNAKEQLTLMGRVQSYVDAHFCEPLTLSVIAEEFHLSAPYLSRAFKKQTSQNLITYIRDKRMEEAKYLLEEGDCSITDIAFRLGYEDYAYFSNVFRRIVGVSPKEYRQNAQRTGKDKILHVNKIK